MSNEITPQALKMAWKMVLTIFDQFHVARADRDALLHLTSLLSLHDLLSDRTAAWSSKPVSASQLSLQAKSAVLKPAAGHPLPLSKILTPDRLEQAYERAEAILDRLGIPELERASLFTALPCLGLEALQRSGLLQWKKPPPFPELG